MNFETCIASCQETHRLCLELATRGDDQINPALLRTLLDTAEMTQTTADFMLRRSVHAVRVTSLCVQICEACAKACEAESGDLSVQRCGFAARRCIASCRALKSAA